MLRKWREAVARHKRANAVTRSNDLDSLCDSSQSKQRFSHDGGARVSCRTPTYLQYPPDAFEPPLRTDCNGGYERVVVDIPPRWRSDRATRTPGLQDAADAADDDRAAIPKMLQDGRGRPVGMRDTAEIDLEARRARQERIRTCVLQAPHVGRC
jgi:hypothetical protein